MVRPTITTITLGLALALGLAPVRLVLASPPAEEAEYVRDVVGRAAAHVDAGRYTQALDVLDRAERERPLPVFVYVRATIEEQRGDCERAVTLYRRFLELDVPAKDAEDARRGVDRCRGEVAAPSDSDTSTSAPTDVPEAEPVATQSIEGSEPPPRPWYADPLGGILVVAGVAGLGVGLGLHGQSRADQRASANATTLQSFDDRSQRAITFDRASIVTLAIGSALVLGGTLRYVFVGTRPRRRQTALTPTGLALRF